MAPGEPIVPKRLIIKFGNGRLGVIDLSKSVATSIAKLNKPKVSSSGGNKFSVLPSSCDISDGNFSIKRSSTKHGSQDLIEDQPKKRQKIIHKDITSDRSQTNLPRRSLQASKQEICQLPASRTSNKSSLSFYERGTSTNATNMCLSSQPKVPPLNVISEKGPKNPTVDAQMSEKKSLRTEMLLNRFASTILKAQQQLLVHEIEVNRTEVQQESKKPQRKPHERDEVRSKTQIKTSKYILHDNKLHHVKIQQEKKVAQRRPWERDKVKVEIREVEVIASRIKSTTARIEMKKKLIEIERKAARLALEKIENTAGFNDNMNALQEFEKLISHSKGEKNYHTSMTKGRFVS